MKKAGIVALAWCALLPGGLDAQDLEARVLELSCAAFPPDLSEADLVSRYGAENVHTQELEWGGEYQAIGTVLFPESLDARLEIIWWNAEDRGKLHDHQHSTSV